MRLIMFVLNGACCLAFTASSAHANEQIDSVGVAKIAITPKEPLWLAGYASRDRPCNGAQHDIWVKAAVFGPQDRSKAVVLITADLLGFNASMRHKICDGAKRKYGLEARQIMLAASHTHSAPVVGAETMYPMDDAQRVKIQAYSDWVVEQSVNAIGAALNNPKASKLSQYETACDFAFNRRNNSEASVPKLRAEGKLKGPVDHRVRVLAVMDPTDSKPFLVVFTYACHNTTLGGNFFKVCGDYAGFAQVEVERAFPGCTAMFVAGCGGDQNPGPRGKLELAEKYGKLLADTVAMAIAGGKSKAVANAPKCIAEDIVLAFDKSPTRAELEKSSKSGPDYYRRWAKRWLSELEAGRPLPTTYAYPVQVWKLGDFTWVSLGGEVVVDYSLRLRRELGSDVWVTAYANDVMAYIPSLRVWKEGGYEGATAMYAWGQPAHRWADDVEERVIKAVHRLVQEVNKN